MDKEDIQFELLTTSNIEWVRKIRREDISEDFVDSADSSFRILS